MMNKSIKKFNKRRFLNLENKESNAYISVRTSDEDLSSAYQYQIVITDCNDKIELHGSLDKRSSRKNAIFKIDSLIDSLTALKSHLLSEFEKRKLKY